MPNARQESIRYATIADGEALSGEVDLEGDRIFAIAVPAAWVAADITLQASYDNGTSFFDVYDQYGNELTIQADASRVVLLDPGLLLGVRILKLRSGPTAAPVDQTGGPLSIPLLCVPG